MLFEMKAIGFLILLTVGTKASINKLFFVGSDMEIICPLEAPFYHWKKYHNNKVTNIFQDDKRKLNISLKLEESPTIYECGATSGFDQRSVNITVFIIDRNSKLAQDLCYVAPFDQTSRVKHEVQYPCFVREQKETTLRKVKGSSAEFDCESTDSNVTYLWLFAKSVNNHKTILKNNKSSTIKVDVNEKSAGNYFCEVRTNTDAKLERVFELILITENNIRNNFAMSIESTETINITMKNPKKQQLNCRTNDPIFEKIQAVKWGKKMDLTKKNIDRSQTIPWEGNLYKLLPENQIATPTDPENRILSSYYFKDVSSETAGEYMCAIITNSGTIKYKTFNVYVINNSVEEEVRQSFFFLYILIPSLIIAICSFIGIYLTINRRPTRKPSNFQSGQKSETDTARLRTTPDYSSVQYQINSPTNTQYPPNHTYFHPYYPSSDKLIV